MSKEGGAIPPRRREDAKGKDGCYVFTAKGAKEREGVLVFGVWADGAERRPYPNRTTFPEIAHGSYLRRIQIAFSLAYRLV